MVTEKKILTQANAVLHQAFTFHQQGQLAQAQGLYEKVLKNNPYHFDGLQLYAQLAYQIKRQELAVDLLSRAIKINPKAVSLYSNMGLVLQELKRLEEALHIYDQAIELEPAFFQAHNNRGNTLMSLKRIEEALLSYDRAIALKPDYAEAHQNRGNALRSLCRFGEAKSSYDRAIALRPNYFEAYRSLGNLLRSQSLHGDALICYDRAIALRPDYAEAYISRGIVLTEINKLDEALTCYEKALALKPDNAAAYGSRGITLARLKRLGEALECFDKSLALRSDDPESYYARAHVLNEMLRLDEARKDFEKTLALEPEHFCAKWFLAFLHIPAVFRSREEAEVSKVLFGKALEELEEWFDSSRLNGAEVAVAAAQPFSLAYQDDCNREILATYGRLTRRLMRYWQSRNDIELQAVNAGGKIKVGVVSSQVRDHPVWEAIAKGWLLNFDSSKFEWHVFSLASVSDKTTELIRRKATSFVENMGSIKNWAKKIIESEIEVLIYPEIGMEGATTQLANLKLAPLQIATWGHPETTGLETIDYYLSADLLEPEDAASSYTETLINLPNLGCTYAPHKVIPNDIDLSTLKISSEKPILLCPGTAYKYLPKHDSVFPRIAQLLGRCTFVFFEQTPHFARVLKLRLKDAFERENMIMEDYVKFVPWLSRENFYALMKRADIFMDTIGFSGFNTAMQAIECSLPVVTIDGRFMRGRLASGILKRLDLSELVCDSEASYCDVIVRLVEDEAFKEQVISKINDRRTVLYNDLEPLRALEAFLWKKCRGSVVS